MVSQAQKTMVTYPQNSYVENEYDFGGEFTQNVCCVHQLSIPQETKKKKKKLGGGLQGDVWRKHDQNVDMLFVARVDLILCTHFIDYKIWRV